MAQVPGELKVWDAQTGDLLHNAQGHAGWVRCVTFSPDGRCYASSSPDGTARLWDVGSNTQVQHFDGHGISVGCVAFSPDSQRVVTGKGNGRLKIWDARTGKEQLTMTVKGRARWITSAAFSPDGRYIVSSTRVNGFPDDPGEVQVWDAQTGEEVALFRGHTGAVASVAFTPDGRRIISSGGDRTGVVWEMPE
jgi:WD40 repeat protein